MQVVSRFNKLYDGLDRVVGEYKVGEAKVNGAGKMNGAARTLKQPLEPIRFENHLAGNVGLGVVPIRDDQCCMFAALDIDDYSIDLKKLNAKVLAHYPFFVLCRSKSGGCHLYVFFTSPARAVEVRSKMRQISETLGFPTVEIFPKQEELKPDDIGNWINLPYFNANGPTVQYAYDSNGNGISAVEDFITLAEDCRIDPDAFIETPLCETEVPFLDGPPCLQRIAASDGGFPSGCRNNGLFNMGVYLRMKYPDDWRDKVDEVNVEFMNPKLGSGEVTQTVKSLEKDKYFYKCKEEPILSKCDKEICRFRKYGIGTDGGDDDGEWRAAVTSVQIGMIEDIRGSMVVDNETPIWVTAYAVELCITYDVLTSQPRMQQLFALNFRKFPISVSVRTWQKIIRDWIENSEWVELETSDTRMGNIYEALCDFCMLHGGADTREEVGLGKVFKYEGDFIFAKFAFKEFLVARGIITSRDASQKELTKIYDVLRKNIGCTGKVFKYDSKGNHTIHTWVVKVETIDNRYVEPPIKLPTTDF